MKTYDRARPEGQPCWFDLVSPDVKGAATFYNKVFGWDYHEDGPEYGHYHTAQIGGRAAAGIGQMPTEGDMPSAWTVYLSAHDVDAMTKRASDLGASVLSEPFDIPEQGRMAIIQDPTGAVFGLWQATAGQHGAEVTDTHGAMTWCEVNTPDSDALKAFYAELCDASVEPIEGAGTTYYVLKQGETSLGGILQMDENWEGVPPHWMTYFQVEHIDEAVKRVEEAGGKVCVAPFDTPFGRIAVIDDPFGATFSVVQLA